MGIYINSYIDSPSSLPYSKLFSPLVDTKAPFYIAAGYLIVVKTWDLLNQKYRKWDPEFGKRPAGLLFKLFIAAHNLGLMIFSFMVFYYTLPVWLNNFSTSSSVKQAFCDSSHQAWDHGLFFWTWLFYLSKFYEFVDTAIILLKGRSPSLLQSYHHAGAVIGMWFLNAYRSPSAWIFVILNSFIHTIMYSYYFLTTLGFRPSGKKYITMMQIIQFIIGCCIAAAYFVVPQCLTPGQLAGTAFNMIYVTPLMFLFYQFAQKSYYQKQKKA